MKNNFILIYLITIISISLIYSLNNPASLNSDYPFSYKKDSNTAIIFSTDLISLFDVTKTANNLDPITQYPISSCSSGEEKGGIFHENYFYTTCLNPSDNSQFNFKTYDSTFNFYRETEYFSFTSAIHFFIKETLVEAAWTNDGLFCTAIFENGEFIQKNDYPVDNMARDVDCIYNTQFQKIICAYGIKEKNAEEFSCSVNIFTNEAFISNLKIFHLCNNHQSRKIKIDNDNNNIFYYYYVDTNFNAYILPLTMTRNADIEAGTPLKIMNGCDEGQSSFEFAQEKFNEYFVFSCVESRFKKKIKIQLFKIEDEQIVFYEDKNVEKTFEFEEDSNSEFSNINFIVLKSTLNFGFLSYRTNTLNARYTIFNQPGCINYELNMNPDEFYQNQETTLDFTNVIKNDNYAGGKIEIYEQGEGLKASVLSSKTDVKIISKDYITGELSFQFIVTNTFYKSDICTAYILVKDCFIHCHTCPYKSTDFFAQECEQGCKPDSYPIINFPLNYNKNCCEKEVDCPNYLYLNINQYEICHISCLACTSGSEYSCTTCYNEKELENYDIIEQGYINGVKRDSTSLYYYWENDGHEKCVNKDNELYVYLDEDTLTYRDCYYSCETCNGHGNSTFNNCKRCREIELYFHFEEINSLNCLNREQAPTNYYLNEDNYSPTETTQSRFWTICDDVCNSCSGGTKEDCTLCAKKYYPKCAEKNSNNNFECYNKIPEKNYFFDEKNNCYEICDSTCATCDKGRNDDVANCLSCESGFILFNRNCYTHCPLPYYELDHKKCIDKCPEYTRFELTKISDNEYYNQCYNCKEINKCIYLGQKTIPLYLVNECIDCTAIAQTFISNTDYNILDDCFELCLTCTERGNVIQMNCLSCSDPGLCLVADFNNCVIKGSAVDNYHMIENPDNTCNYEKCYISCKSCSGSGDAENNNCIYCADGYQPDPQITGNCVKMCQYYWYIDPSTNKFTCTEGASCPRQMQYLAELNKECVSDCIYAYNFNTIALYKYKKTCVTQCPDNTMKDNLYYICHSLDDSVDVFNHVQNYISYQAVSPKNLLIYSNDKTKYFHLFNTTRASQVIYQQAAKGVGTSLVDFSYCLATLRRELGYDRNEIFYIGVMDVIREDTSAPQIEYTIHDHNGVKLDINLCQNDVFVINKSFALVEDMQLARYIQYYYNYDIVDYNKDNKFFCDICSKFEYDKQDPYDVILNDRYDSFYQNKDYYFCEKICDEQYTKLYLNDSRVECVCKGKKTYTELAKEDFTQFNKIDQICHDWFLQYFKCGNNFFNKDFFKKNYANVIMFIFVLMEILCVFLFFFISKKKLRNDFKFVLTKKSKLRKQYLKENPLQENGAYDDYINEYNNSTNREYIETSSNNKNSVTNSNTNTNSEEQQESSEQTSKTHSSQSNSKSKSSKSYKSSSNKTHSSYSKSGSQSGSQSNQSNTNTKSKRNDSKKTNSNNSSNNNEDNNIDNDNDDDNNEDENSNSQSQENSKKESNKSKSQSNKEKSEDNKNEASEKTNSKKEPDEIEEISDEDNEEEENDNDKDDNDNEENSNANPPKKQKRRSKNTSNYDDNIINIEDIDEDEIEKEEKNNKKKKKKNEEEKNDKTENKKAPKTAFEKYSKRFLMNRKDYVDNEYHEDSYNFKLDKNLKKRGSGDYDSYEDEESDEEGEEFEDSEGSEDNEESGQSNIQGTNTRSKSGESYINNDTNKNSSKNSKTNSGSKNSGTNSGSKISSNKNSNSNTATKYSKSNKSSYTKSSHTKSSHTKSSYTKKSKTENSNSYSNSKYSKTASSNKSGSNYTNSNNLISETETTNTNSKQSTYKSKRTSKTNSQVLSINSSKQKRSSSYGSKSQTKSSNKYSSETSGQEKSEEPLYPQLITEKRTFSDAIKKFENKSFCFLYWYILKKRHHIISLFIQRDKYDFFSIKFSYLILSFILDFFFITFFYLDYVIRYQYEKKKHIEPLCTILLGIGTPAVSHAVMWGMDYFMDNLKKKFKDYEKNEENVQKNYVWALNTLIKEYTKAIIIYFSIDFVFTLFVWYMVGTFIGTFYYVQNMWFIIFAINAFISIFFPLIYYLIAVKLQYEGIHQKDIKLFRKGMNMQKI